MASESPFIPADSVRPSPAAASGEPEPGATAGMPQGSAGAGRPQRVALAGLGFDPLTETQAVRHIIESARQGRGGWVATPNIDICRVAATSPALRTLLGSASLVVPDGMPLLWAARLRGDTLPERVAGSSLIFSLTEAAAENGLSIYLLGGEPGVPARAAEALRNRYPGLVVTGSDSPRVDREPTAGTIGAVRSRLAAAAPDIVYVGLGFPKQERLIDGLAASLPGVWFISCGAAIPFAAGAVPRAPRWMQNAGLEWVFRLMSEPRRLFGRYVLHDIPYAGRLLASSALRRLRPTARA
jgi:N-acetylglucosaminyldiphosphoundecaprenol N-acetyl-beta-D-mannosaminyltransferase